jgi:hypothetical protein
MMGILHKSLKIVKTSGAIELTASEPPAEEDRGSIKCKYAIFLADKCYKT